MLISQIKNKRLIVSLAKPENINLKIIWLPACVLEAFNFI